MRGLSCALLVAVGLSLASTRATAQEVDSRGALWIAARVQKTLAKDWKLEARPEVRLLQEQPPSTLMGLSLDYRPWKPLTVSGGYRFTAQADDDAWAGHRLHGDAQGRLKLGSWVPSLRLRATHTLGPSDPNETRLRPRLALAYSPHKTLSLRGLAETFFDPDEGEFRKMRYGGDATYRFSKSKQLQQFIRVGYRLDYFLLKSKNTHIIQTSYKVTF